MARREKLPEDRVLPKITLALFSRSWLVFAIWLVLIVFGALSYSTLLKREGFPSVDFPLALVNGTYIVNDSAKVDADVSKPISEAALKQDKVSMVQTQSSSNFLSVIIQYEEGTDAPAATKQLEQKIKSSGVLPDTAAVQFNTMYFGVTGGDTKKIDSTISFYRAEDSTATDTKALTTKAEAAVAYLNKHKPPLVETFFLQDPFEQAVNPATGQLEEVQRSFDRFGLREQQTTTYHNSVIINVTAQKGADVIELDKQVQATIADMQKQTEFAGHQATVSASYAPSITESISELQRVLLEGLIAVLVIGSIVIAVRASIITVLSMVTVVLSTIGLIYLLGYSLNVITLFALILGLSLIVDDTIIMVEAIDASRRHTKTAREAVRMAIRKVSRAMMAATLTATLSFAPLLFVGGILGKFIHAIPVTIISALLISLMVALVFIPLFAKFLLLGKKQMGEGNVREVAAGVEAAVARTICRPMLWARHSTKKLLFVGSIAVLIGLIFIGSAGAIFNKVTFNLFPPTKDTNALSVSLTFPDGATIEQAQATTDRADRLTATVLDDYFIKASYFGRATAAEAMSQIDITSYNERDITSPQLVEQLQTKFDKEFQGAVAKVRPVDVGPPVSAFTVQVQTENRPAGYKLANDIAAYLKDVELERPSGKKAHFTTVAVSSPSQYIRSDGKLSINVTGDFDADDTTTLVTLAQNAVKEEFDEQKIATYGLPKDALSFDIGQESENQDSFKSMVIAFPIMLLAIYLLLAVEFRSLLQPLLIFLAIPFSLFGVTLGLYLTDNAFSFFVAMGFFALIGLSLKNTILLTDYANQSRRNGMGVIDSVVAALSERFRPLVATSLTAVVALIPLALTSPFWQGLAVVLIFGLLSSTTLVILVFPYYYLGGEFLRLHISRRSFFIWLLATVALAFGFGKINSSLTLLAVPITLVAGFIVTRMRKAKKAH